MARDWIAGGGGGQRRSQRHRQVTKQDVVRLRQKIPVLIMQAHALLSKKSKSLVIVIVIYCHICHFLPFLARLDSGF